MKTMKQYILLILLLSITITGSFGRNPMKIKTLSGKEISTNEMDRFLKRQMDSLNVKGISIAVINDGTIIYHRAFGIAGIANACSYNPVNNQTLFQAASISKPIFAYFVMKMVDKGILDLDIPLYKYLPYPDIEDDPRYKMITARMVLCHRSGLPNWRPNNYTGKLTVDFTPGTKFSYSGEGYMYLAKVIAHLTNTTLANLDSVFQKEVCVPLDIKHAYFGLNGYSIKHLARGYFGDRVHEDLDFIQNFNPAGGLCTEAKSFANFLIALMNEDGLSAESMDEMFKAQAEVPDNNKQNFIFGAKEWSLGFSRKPSEYGMNFAHGGNNWGFSSQFLFNKEQKFGYVFFTNSNSCDNPQCPELWQKIEPLLIHGNNS